jgi:hypothetical protein
MHKEVLTKKQIELLPLINNFKNDYFLVGGTAIALYLGHRRSIDFDLFTYQNIKKRTIKNTIEKNGFYVEKNIFEDYEQLHLIVNSIKLTFFQFNHKIPHTIKFDNIIKIPSLLDLAGMKAYALGGRAKWKDYVDLYFIIKYKYSLKEISKKAKELFDNFFNEKLFLEQLSYFEDIDFTEHIEYINKPIPKQKIKNFLIEISTRSF